MFAIGAFTFPLLLLAMTRTNSDNWIYACSFMLIMGVLSWVMYFMIPDSVKEKKEEQIKKLLILLFSKNRCFISAH